MSLLEKYQQHLATFENRWKSRTLANGVKCLHIPLPNDQRLQLSAVFDVGSRVESKRQAGLSHFLEHMMFRGTKQYPSFAAVADQFEWLGGEWNGATSQEHTEYTFTGTRETAHKAIELFAEFLNNPLLLDLEKEREIIQREIDDELNEFDLSTDLDFHTCATMWPDSGLSLPITGSKESVARISLNDLQTFRQLHYHPENLAISVAGGPDDDSMLDLLANSFEQYSTNTSAPFPCREKIKPFKGPILKWVQNSDNQCHVQINYQCQGEWSDNDASYELLSRILGEGFSCRLTQRLREELGLVYDVSCDVTQFKDRGYFSVSASTTPGSLKQLLQEVESILSRLASTGPTAKELEKAQHCCAIESSLVDQDEEEIALRFAWSALKEKPSSFLKELDTLMKISCENLQQTAQKLFSPQNRCTIILGPKKAQAYLNQTMVEDS